MGAAIHEDGDFTVYIVERFSDRKWRYAGIGDVFAANIPSEKRFQPGPYGKTLSPFADFGASGECWQRTGIHGVFDPKVGMAYVTQLTEHNPGVQFRLAEVRITQHTKPYKGDPKP